MLDTAIGVVGLSITLIDLLNKGIRELRNRKIAKVLKARAERAERFRKVQRVALESALKAAGVTVGCTIAGRSSAAGFEDIKSQKQRQQKLWGPEMYEIIVGSCENLEQLLKELLKVETRCFTKNLRRSRRSKLLGDLEIMTTLQADIRGYVQDIKYQCYRYENQKQLEDLKESFSRYAEESSEAVERFILRLSTTRRLAEAAHNMLGKVNRSSCCNLRFIHIDSFWKPHGNDRGTVAICTRSVQQATCSRPPHLISMYHTATGPNSSLNSGNIAAKVTLEDTVIRNHSLGTNLHDRVLHSTTSHSPEPKELLSFAYRLSSIVVGVHGTNWLGKSQVHGLCSRSIFFLDGSFSNPFFCSMSDHRSQSVALDSDLDAAIHNDVTDTTIPHSRFRDFYHLGRVLWELGSKEEITGTAASSSPLLRQKRMRSKLAQVLELGYGPGPTFLKIVWTLLDGAKGFEGLDNGSNGKVVDILFFITIVKKLEYLANSLED